jgi:hypothetical protein
VPPPIKAPPAARSCRSVWHPASASAIKATIAIEIFRIPYASIPIAWIINEQEAEEFHHTVAFLRFGFLNVY